LWLQWDAGQKRLISINTKDLDMLFCKQETYIEFLFSFLTTIMHAEEATHTCTHILNVNMKLKFLF